jgi:hypothetical protein
MPVVPTANDLGYVPADTPRGPTATPADFGAQVGQSLQTLGQGFDQASNASTQILQMQTQADMNVRFHQLQDFIQKRNFGDPTDPNAPPGYYALKGKQAVDAYQPTIDAINSMQAKLGSGLPAFAQSQFQAITRRYVDAQLGSMGQHFVQQNGAYLNETDQALIDGDHQNAVAYYDNPDQIKNALADSQATVVKMGQRNGFSPDSIQAAVVDNRSKLFSAVIDRKAQLNPLSAWDFYQQNQGAIGGAYQAAIEQKLKPQIDLWDSRTQADGMIAGVAARTAASVAAEARAQGIDPALALTTAKIESGMGTNVQSPGNSAFGVFQMTPSTWAAQGGTATNRTDPTAQVQLGIKNLGTSQSAAEAALGRAPEPWETYLVHQQGAAGGPALLKADPTANVVTALAPAYGGNASKAQAAIVNNGGAANMTVGDFLNAWRDRYAQVAGTITVPPPGATATAQPAARDIQQQLPSLLEQANGALDFRGIPDPNYQAMLQERLRQKAAEIEYGQAQADRAAKSVLLSAAMGLRDPGATLTGGTPASGPVVVAPTSMEQMFQNSPQAHDAFVAADPETQRSVMEIVRQNATQGPPPTEAAIDRYYQLRGEAANDPQAFLSENLADHDLVTTMPRDYLHQLMGIQASIDKNAVAQAAKQESLIHARDVLMPDLQAAGIVTRNPTPAQKQVFDQFYGRLDEALQQFQQANNRRPLDNELRGIGQQLLTPGYLRGTGSLWGLLPNDSSTRLFQAQTAGQDAQFYPAVPDTDRKAIVSAYAARHNGADPTDAQVQRYFMLGQANRSAPAPVARRAPGALPMAPIDNGGSAPQTQPLASAPGAAPAS